MDMPGGPESGAHRSRHLDWEGCFNARDLGGLPTAGGGRTRWGAVVRADALDGLSEAGWAALVEHDVRTVVDLRNDDEVGADAAPRPASVTTVRIPLLLLALAGVPADAIAADYALSAERLPARYAARGEPDQGPAHRAFLAERGTTAEGLVVALLERLDVAAHLRAAGLGEAELVALRRRLVA